MTALEVLQKAFGESVKPVFSQGFDKDVSNLIKYQNFTSLNKNVTKNANLLKDSSIRNMSLIALYNTKKYYSADKSHKLNITK